MLNRPGACIGPAPGKRNFKSESEGDEKSAYIHGVALDVGRYVNQFSEEERGAFTYSLCRSASQVLLRLMGDLWLLDHHLG